MIKAKCLLAFLQDKRNKCERMKKKLIGALKYFLRFLPDKCYIRLLYWRRMKRFVDLKNPKTFSEKLQWLKLYDRNPEYTKMVDKYEVKNYIASIIGDEYVIPTLGVWTRFDDIDFEKLPNRFVLKCTHNSGGVIICADKTNLDLVAAKKEIEKHLRKNYYVRGREWPYKNVKPRIIAEKYIGPSGLINGNFPLEDYKFMCFHGKVKCSFVCSDRSNDDELKVTFFDREWKKMPFERKYPASQEEIPKPLNYKKMILLSEKIAQNLTFARVDFYEFNGKVYFGEITLYPGSGLEKFSPFEWDYKFGSWLDISAVKQTRK